MADFHFIDDPLTLEIISTILSAAGPNFPAPYDSDSQPSDAVSRYNEPLTHFDLPGGTFIKGVSNTSASPNMSWVISGLLTALGPVISAYGFILPIIGVIRGIIEIVCCSLNPRCLIPAVIRLFKKWLPALIALFPAFAGLIFIVNVLKLMLAIIFFILTEIVPTLELIRQNIKVVIGAFDDENEARAEAGKQKLTALIIDLLNRSGILALIKPILDIIFLILGLSSGFPCGGGDESSNDTGSLALRNTPFDGSISDSNCCGDDMCPPELKTPPNGRGLLIPVFYGDAPPLWTWKLVPITGGENIPKLRPYLQNLKSQLNPQLDEEIDEASSVGSNGDAAHFKLRIIGRRGEKFCRTDDSEATGGLVVPIARMESNSNVTVTNYNLTSYMGVVDYCIEPNYYQLVGKGIIGVGCHPEVEEAKNSIQERFDNIELSALDKNPELLDVPSIYSGLISGLNSNLDSIKSLVDKPVEDFSLDDVDSVQEIQDTLVALLFDVSGKFQERLNILLSKMSDRISSTFETDKNVVKASVTDKAIISVTPRDVTGTPIASNLPTGVDISVDILTDFGTLQNQVRNNLTGTITAELISPFVGTANIMAKVNKDFIMNFDGVNQTVKVETVRFVADAILPKRRVVSKPTSGSKRNTGTNSEREPGSR